MTKMERVMVDLTKIFYRRNEHWMIQEAGYSDKIKLTAIVEIAAESINEDYRTERS